MHGLIPDMVGTHLYWNILGDVVLTPSSETPIACTEKDCKDRITVTRLHFVFFLSHHFREWLNFMPINK